jgi:hypothetical protein
MRTTIAALGIIGLGLASGPVLAEEVADGVVDLIDRDAQVITLADGQEFVVTDGAHEITDLQSGDKVTITYDVDDGKNVVSSILPAEPNE